MYKLADMHCDTAHALFHRKESFLSNSCHISLDKASVYDKYLQVCAIWSDSSLSDDEALKDFYRIYHNFTSELSLNSLTLSHSAKDIEKALQLSQGRAFVLALEDARIIKSNAVLEDLNRLGMKIMTMLWQGDTCIGGSFDTHNPLTEHGKGILARALELGIIPDISHASHESARDILDMAQKCGRPVIASHSNSYSVFDHPRNLSDELLDGVIASGGIVGISLAPQHLCEGECTVDSVLRHIEHYLNRSAQNALCLGCDFDGISKTPQGLEDASRLPCLFDEVEKNFGGDIANKLFFENAYEFLTNNIR